MHDIKFMAIFIEVEIKEKISFMVGDGGLMVGDGVEVVVDVEE